MVNDKGNLLEDVMTNILSRLPVKSLIRFRSICKSWYVLLQNHTFISKHLKNFSNENIHLIVDYLYAEDNRPRYALALFSDTTLADLSFQDIDCQNPVPGAAMGPYDGIFCLYANNRITLWNLATRESNTLPKYKTTLPPYTKFYYPNAGFGLDPKSNDYKLVLIRALWDNKRQEPHELSNVAIFTLSTYSWKHIKGIELIHYFLQKTFDSTYLNGICYWLASLDFDDNEHQVILSFDMGNEVFQEIEQPCTSTSPSSMTLGLYNDNLSFLLLDIINNFFGVWVNKEGYWIKELTIGPILGVHAPLGFWKSGAFFMLSNIGQLLLYDPRTEEIRDLSLRTHWLEVHNYKESLIKIKTNDILSNYFDIPWHVLGVYLVDDI